MRAQAWGWRAVFVSSWVAAACGVPASQQDEAAWPDEVAALEGQLGSDLVQGLAPEDVLGPWEGKLGPFVGMLIVGDESQTFVGEHQTSCARPPCPTTRLEGSWRANARLLALSNGEVWRVFQYVRSGGELMLYSNGRRYARLVRAETFCNLPQDCLMQSYFHELCIGGPTCAANRCGWECGGFASPCDDYLCTVGEHCESAEGEPKCLPDADSQCDRIRCGAPRPHCVSSEGESECIAEDQCHRHSECAAGTYCRSEVECNYAPCFSPLVCR